MNWLLQLILHRGIQRVVEKIGKDKTRGLHHLKILKLFCWLVVQMLPSALSAVKTFSCLFSCFLVIVFTHSISAFHEEAPQTRLQWTQHLLGRFALTGGGSAYRKYHRSFFLFLPCLSYTRLREKNAWRQEFVGSFWMELCWLALQQRLRPRVCCYA